MTSNPNDIPSDEEIEKEAYRFCGKEYEKNNLWTNVDCFEFGAKWAREQAKAKAVDPFYGDEVAIDSESWRQFPKSEIGREGFVYGSAFVRSKLTSTKEPDAVFEGICHEKVPGLEEIIPAMGQLNFMTSREFTRFIADKIGLEKYQVLFFKIEDNE